jgi:hypothetical protein
MYVGTYQGASVRGYIHVYINVQKRSILYVVLRGDIRMPSGQDRHDTPHCMSLYEYVYVQYVQALNDECVGKTTRRFWSGSKK